MFQNSSDPWDIVEEHWFVIKAMRLNTNFNTNSEEWGVTLHEDLQKPKGYNLVRFKQK